MTAENEKAWFEALVGQWEGVRPMSAPWQRLGPAVLQGEFQGRAVVKEASVRKVRRRRRNDELGISEAMAIGDEIPMSWDNMAQLPLEPPGPPPPYIAGGVSQKTNSDEDNSSSLFMVVIRTVQSSRIIPKRSGKYQ
ncbi:hypothetical protein COOONC_15307 [Cooperia oncophora]